MANKELDNLRQNLELSAIRRLVRQGRIESGILKRRESQITQEETVIFTPPPVETIPQPQTEVKENIPFIQVDKENRAAFMDGAKYIFKGEISWQAFLLLARNPNFPVLGKAVEKTAKKAGSKAKHAIAGDTVDRIRDTLKIDTNSQLISVIRYRRNVTYQLNARVEFLKGQVAETAPFKEIEETGVESLSEDEALKRFLEKATPNEKSIVKFFMARDKYGLRETTYAGLTHYIYGEIPKKVRYNRLSVALVNLRKKLAEVGYEIVSEKKRKGICLTLRKKGEEKVPESLIPEEEITEEVDIQEIKKASREEPEFIPYVPTEEEKRSKQETIVLDTIISMLLSNPRIRFEELQKHIYSKESEKEVLGGKIVYIYQGQEIKELFVLALSKIREEAEIQTIRQEWSQEDKIIWQKVDQAINKIAGDDIDFFIRKVKEEISRSERQFYRDYPPSSGQKITWIRRRHHE